MTLVILSLLYLTAIYAGCHPECTYECDNPVCAANCQPQCDSVKCRICEQINVNATPVCEEDFIDRGCEIRCPADQCESDSCPQCEVICAGSLCDDDPTCVIECEQIACGWDCQKPTNCPQPICILQCEQPACAVTSAGVKERAILQPYSSIFLLIILLIVF